MRYSSPHGVSLVLVALAVYLHGVAAAQAAEPAMQPDAATPAKAPPAADKPVEAKPAVDKAAPAGEKVAPEKPVAAPDLKWYELLEVGAFVDGYLSVNPAGPKPQGGVNRFHPYNANNGFGVAWAGIDLALKPDPVGGAVNLRFGPSVPNLALGDFGVPGGIGNLQQAFVSWKPDGKDGKLTLILGKFDTIYGAEVAASQNNMNYTRGALYNLAQPFFHTGLRADWAVSDLVGLKFLAVNGWNNTIDNNQGKSFGTQLALTPSPAVTFALGYLGGPEASDTQVVANPDGSTSVQHFPNANARWRHMVDVVADLKPTDSLRFLLNGTVVTDDIEDAAVPGTRKNVGWYGASAMARYAFTDVYAASVRGEYIHDNNNQILLLAPTEFATSNTQSVDLITGTLTLEAAPSKYLLFRLDSRLDKASEKAFKQGIGDPSETQVTFTLGAVAKTN